MVNQDLSRSNNVGTEMTPPVAGLRIGVCMKEHDIYRELVPMAILQAERSHGAERVLSAERPR